jgi:hypothetical protein
MPRCGRLSVLLDGCLDEDISLKNAVQMHVLKITVAILPPTDFMKEVSVVEQMVLSLGSYDRT